MKTQISFLLKTTDFWPIVLAGSLVMAMISGIYAQNGGPGGPPPDEQGGPNGDGPGAPPEGGPGGPGGFGGPGGADGPGGGPGGHSKTCVLNGVYLVDGKTVQTENEHYVSATNDWSAIYVKNGGALTLVNPTITTTGNTSSQDNSSFYGLNAGILATKNSKIIMLPGFVKSWRTILNPQNTFSRYAVKDIGLPTKRLVTRSIEKCLFGFVVIGRAVSLPANRTTTKH